MAERFAAAKMKIVLADVEGPALAATFQSMQDAGATVAAFRADVSRSSDVENLADFAYTNFGAVHILCNNAGVAGGGAPAAGAGGTDVRVQCAGGADPRLGKDAWPAVAARVDALGTAHRRRPHALDA